jgi:Holliday junction resolvase RusA-like endonuclease
MSDVVELTVIGLPVPQGSLRAMVSPQGKAVVPQADQRLLRYRADLRHEGQRSMRERKVTLMAWAVSVQVTFVLPRPATHFLPINKRRDAPELRPEAPVYPMGTPDLDKLCRSVLDALTGIVFADDAQVISLYAAKVYAEEPVFPGLTKLRITGGNDPWPHRTQRSNGTD